MKQRSYVMAEEERDSTLHFDVKNEISRKVRSISERVGRFASQLILLRSSIGAAERAFINFGKIQGMLRGDDRSLSDQLSKE